jgi:hypothetical protein
MKLFSLIVFLAFLLGTSADVSSLISESLFNEMLKHRNDQACKSNGFYTYNAFIAASQSFNDFGTVGDDTTRKREVAAFLGQTSHETTGEFRYIHVVIYLFIYFYVCKKFCPHILCNNYKNGSIGAIPLRLIVKVLMFIERKEQICLYCTAYISNT